MHPPSPVDRFVVWLRSRVAHIRSEPEAGYSTEAILVTAALVLIAAGAVAAIGVAVSGWVEDIVNAF